MVLKNALVLLLMVVAMTAAVMVNERRKVLKGQVSHEILSNKQKALIIILCLLNPAVTGAILYYGWRKQLPEKAKQANNISWWAFPVTITVGMIVF